jgi:hypothetical protein
MAFVSLRTTRWKDGKWFDYDQTIPVEDIKSIEPYNKTAEQNASPRHQDTEMSKVYLKSTKATDPYLSGAWNSKQAEGQEKALFLIVLRRKEDLDVMLGAIRT